VNAQTIHVTDQNIFDLVPDRDAISGLAGSQRIKASFWEDNGYTIPLDVAAALPITLTISSTVDDYAVTVLNSATSTPPNVVWWVVPFLNAGSYRAQATAVFTDDQFPVFDRFLTLTNVPAAPTSFFLTNEVTVGAVGVTNIFEAGSFPTYVSNYVDLAEYHITNIYFPTSGVVSLNGFTGAVSLVTQATTNSAGVSLWDGLTLNVGTGFPSYLVRQSELAIYATGTPLYAFTESDTIWSGASNLYYQASQADALFATGTPLYQLSSDVVLKSAIGDIAGDNLYGTGGKLNVRGKALSYGPMELNQFSGTLFQNSGYATGIASNSTPSAFGFYQVQSGSAVINPRNLFGENKFYKVYAAFRCDGGFNDGLHGLIRLTDSNGQSYNLSGLTDVYIGTTPWTIFSSSSLNSGSNASYSYRLEVYFAAYNGGNGATIQDTTIYLIGDI
jgi:hypothetical protein